MSAITRRSFLEGGAQTVSLLALSSVSAVWAAASESCVKPESESLRRSLEYTDPAPDPRQSCTDCGFFTADKSPCGTCALINGPVSSKAHCHSWSDRNG
jgi:High potential iron-sulfur protein